MPSFVSPSIHQQRNPCFTLFMFHLILKLFVYFPTYCLITLSCIFPHYHLVDSQFSVIVLPHSLSFSPLRIKGLESVFIPFHFLTYPTSFVLSTAVHFHSLSPVFKKGKLVPVTSVCFITITFL